MNPLDALFERTRSEGRAALIGYLPAGFPSVAGSVAAMQAMVVPAERVQVRGVVSGVMRRY